MSTLEDALNRWLERYPSGNASSPPRATCPTPLRFGQDQYRCSECNTVWDTDEERPPCTKDTDK